MKTKLSPLPPARRLHLMGPRLDELILRISWLRRHGPQLREESFREERNRQRAEMGLQPI